MYMEASGVEPGKKARLISPLLDNVNTEEICLSFRLVVFSLHPGNLHILNEAEEVVWSHIGCELLCTPSLTCT